MPFTNTSLRNPTPPGVGHDDPLYQVLQRQVGLYGPFLKLYYDWGKRIQREGPDQYKKGDGLNRKAWLEGLRENMLRNRQKPTEE